MKATGIVVARREGLGHRFAVELTSGPDAGATFVLVGYATPGWNVEVEYDGPDAEFATITHVERECA